MKPVVEKSGTAAADTSVRAGAGFAWHPIATCPPMTAVLLYAAGYHIGHFNETNNRWWTHTDGTGTAGELLLNSWSRPTHWMPLPPEPPQHEVLGYTAPEQSSI